MEKGVKMEDRKEYVKEHFIRNKHFQDLRN